MGKGKKIEVKDDVYPATAAQLNSFFNAVNQIVASDFSPDSLQEVASKFSTSPGPFLRLCARALRKGDPHRQKAIILLVSGVEGEESRGLLKSLLVGKDIGIELKGLVLSILKEKEAKIPPGLELLVTQGSSWLTRAFSAFSADEQEVSRLTQELGSFPLELKREVMERLAGEGDRALPFIKNLVGASPEVDELVAEVLGRIPCQASVSFLAEIVSTARNKRVEKAARKSLFLLRGRGFAVEVAPKREAAPVLAIREEGEDCAYVSGIDYLGYRLLWLFRTRPGRGTVIFHAVLSDSQGITAFSSRETTRKGLRRYRDQVMGENNWLVTEVDYKYGCQLLEESYLLNMSRGIDPPREYLEVRAKLKSSLEEPGPLIYKLLGSEKIGKEDFPLGIERKVWQIPELSSWRLEPEAVEKYARKVEEIKESRILVTPEQKRAAVEEIYEKGARELFDDDRRRVYKRRLEEMAALFLLKKREEDARVALAVALSLERESPLLPVNLFTLELTKKAISVALKDEARVTPTLVTP